MKAAPTRVPTSVPRPPSRLAPPITTAPITSNSAPRPASGAPVWRREASTTPLSPAQKPDMVKVARRTRSTSMPDRRVASSFPPTA